uniref:hypothetical protein n=1 Tax=Candidatus Fimivicinus sp. TaxID=3056640 RepID=UPI003FEECCE5
LCCNSDIIPQMSPQHASFHKSLHNSGCNILKKVTTILKSPAASQNKWAEISISISPLCYFTDKESSV